MTSTIGRWRTAQERRESASERAAAAAAVLAALDAEVKALPPRRVDRSALRRVVRALLPLVLDDPTFDGTVMLGETGVAVRLYHDARGGPTVRVLTGVGAPEVLPDPPTAPMGSHVAAELADLLRRGAVRPR